MKNLTLINSSGQEVTINVDNEDVMSMVRADVKKGDLKLVGKATSSPGTTNPATMETPPADRS